MSITSVVLAGLLAMVFIFLGTAKVLAVAPMRERAAAAGLLLLAGALASHLRNGDGVREYAPALLCAALVVAYLAALYGASR